jgi:hypothetical protein
MWEMFDFGHNATLKERKESFQSFAKTSDKPTLRPAYADLYIVSVTVFTRNIQQNERFRTRE